MHPFNPFSAGNADDQYYDSLADALKPDWDLLDRHHWRRHFEQTHGSKLGDRELDQRAEWASAALGPHRDTLAAQRSGGDSVFPGRSGLANKSSPTRRDLSGRASPPRQNYSAPIFSYKSDPRSYAVGIPVHPQYYNPYPEDPPVQLPEQRREPSFVERFNIKPSSPPPPPGLLEQFFQDYIVPFLRNTYPAPKAPETPKHILNTGRRADLGPFTIGRRIYV